MIKVQRVVLHHPGKSSYHDGLVWFPTPSHPDPNCRGIWLKPDESIVVVKTADIPATKGPDDPT